ncbi:hypothetical protein ACFVIN_13895, partial [Streptomyces prasinus]
MKRPLRALLLVLGGISPLHITLFTDLCLRYVKEWTHPGPGGGGRRARSARGSSARAGGAR